MKAPTVAAASTVESALSPDSIRLLQALSYVLGWIYTLSWSLSFYPQPLLNIRRSSTTGTTPSFPILNVLGFASYTFSTLAFYTSERIQSQYEERHGGEPNTVRGNDVAFAVHALLLCLVTLSQFWPRLWGFESRKWKVGKGIWGIVIGCTAGIAWTVVMVITGGGRGWQWIDVVYAAGYVKLIVTVFKYIPQAWANYERKSTVGWSIGQILMDFIGGILSFAQLLIDSSLQKDWSGLTGNPVKLGLSNISVFFDVIFMVQHYILYRHAANVVERKINGEEQGLIARHSDDVTDR